MRAAYGENWGFSKNLDFSQRLCARKVRIKFPRASKITLLRQRTQFAKTFAFAGKVNAVRVKLVCS